MPAPVPSWGTCRVFGTWYNLDGSRRTGTYKVTYPVRVTNTPDDGIIPAGIGAQGSLSTDTGLPSLDLDLPASDDPDNSPSGWQPTITVTFTNAAEERYVLDLPLGGEVNLRQQILTTSIPAPLPVLIRGVPGGIAELDADGDVVNADGEKVTGGGASLTSYETQVEALPDYPTALPTDAARIADATTVGRSVLTAADAAAARAAIGAGTSSLALGTTGSTAKAGNYQPAAANISDSTATGRAVLTAADPAAARSALGAAPTASPTFTGTVTVPDAAFSQAKVSGLTAALDGKASTAITAVVPPTIRSTGVGTWPVKATALAAGGYTGYTGPVVWDGAEHMTTATWVDPAGLADGDRRKVRAA